jgi:two-component system phosphate regulon sensor histidine kinase PhoR
VTLRGEPDGDGWVVSVVDTGAGVEPQHAERIFERFYRVDAGRSREQGGTGLGLSIVKHLVHGMGGEVGVESGAGGSRFWVRLPAA